MTTPDEASNSLSQSQQAAQQIARRLISTPRPERPGDDSPARIAAAACDYLYRALSRWVGPDGCHALYARALAQAANEYPALEKIQLRPRSEPYIDGVAQTIMEHGDGATTKAFESMLVRLIELLSRLIGDDMAMKLIEQSWAAPERGDANSDDRREEA